ncbi:nucleotide-binding universal stress UspA family protein [Devosia subaequoris]|uniref:Nucleotide-binding universal stress UspA family protein n=1 Tax=Devosia subaequoris TaxID=395930 RepID=A0A7W6IN30_9HYPH|nr:universal stress protein [Devosia subaequoris]MBB4052146.1 nucleotide-binding universal stress UspA family protein [Devosia subaequoris]MCP1209311.1 universal stress protein [Devosia subaequoris]
MLTDVLLPLFSDPEETPVQGLLQIAKLQASFSRTVTLCGVESDVPALANHWGARMASIPEMAQQVEQRSRDKIAQLLREAGSVLGEASYTTINIRASFTDPGDRVAQTAGNYDLTVLPLRAGSVAWREIAESILFGSTRPVLLGPASEYPQRLDCVAIAWDGGAPAHRAVFDAMPLISQASSVVVLVADEEKHISPDSAGELIGYLRRHRVEAKLARLPAGQGKIGLDLQHAAQAADAGLLVMGAYGHSRLREFVLGGATADVLGETMMPLFMSR